MPTLIKNQTTKLLKGCRNWKTTVKKFEDPEGNFVKRIFRFLDEKEEELEDQEKKNEDLNKEFETLQDWFMFPKVKESA
jgi:hypothetical protein